VEKEFGTFPESNIRSFLATNLGCPRPWIDSFFQNAWSNKIRSEVLQRDIPVIQAVVNLYSKKSPIIDEEKKNRIEKIVQSVWSKRRWASSRHNPYNRTPDAPPSPTPNRLYLY
jgi:hypothetical protein